MTDVQLWVQDVEGAKFPWEMFWDGFWRPDGKARCYTRFKCLVVEADLFKVQLVPRHDQLTAGETVFDMVSPYDAALTYSSVILPSDLGCQTKVVTELWDCMLLGVKPNNENPDVMLLRFDVDAAERVWTGPLWPEKSYRAGPRASFPPSIRRRFKLC